ncbi:hypothetical protein [Pseudomonas sp. H2_H03]
MLDLYLDRPKHTRGYSQDSTVPFEQISEAFYRLAPINEVFEKNVTDYYAGLKGGADVAIKHLMSLLPEDDKKALEYGELSVYAEEDVTRTSHFANRVEQFSYESRQPDDNRSLLFVTTYQGRKTVYEVNPQQGFVRKRTDLSPDLKPKVDKVSGCIWGATSRYGKSRRRGLRLSNAKRGTNLQRSCRPSTLQGPNILLIRSSITSSNQASAMSWSRRRGALPPLTVK